LSCDNLRSSTKCKYGGLCMNQFIPFIILMTMSYISISFGRWLYDALSRRYPIFKELERSLLAYIIATTSIFLIIFMQALFSLLSLERMHIYALTLFFIGFLTPLSVLPRLGEVIRRRRQGRSFPGRD